MTSICSSKLPEDALLKRYEQSEAFTDCYRMELPGTISMDDYVTAFYTSTLFKVERRLLGLIAGKHANDADARRLALGQAAGFSAWRVEDRNPEQLLLCDVLGRTRSWLMVDAAGAATTTLYFGSAVVPLRRARSAEGKPSFGFAFHALSGFHRLYSKALMRAARSKLAATGGNGA